MLRSWKLGTAFGIGIFIHWTFLLLPAWILLNNLGGGVPLAAYLLTLVTAVFGCVVLHELGHALMARRFGIATRDITLYPIGGVARLEQMSEKPLEEFWIAVAGPAVNVVIAGVLFGILAVLGLEPQLFPFLHQLVFGLLVANVFLVLFNLLPAFPMDGGRVLRALLAMRLGRLRATEIAAQLGLVMAVLMGVASFFLHAPSMALVAVFVFFAGQQELMALRHREAVRRAEPLWVLPADPEPPAFGGFTGIRWNGPAQAWEIWRNGRPVGLRRIDVD